MRADGKILTFISLVYIYMPIAFFLFGWTNKIIAIVTSIAIIFCMYRMLRDISKNRRETDRTTINAAALLFAILLFCWVGYYAGWGRWVTQTSDWKKHNAILSDLVGRRWPVMYRNGSEHSMLSYYIAYYLVPAFVGKLTHSFRAAEKMMYIWGVSGLILVYLNLMAFIKPRNNTVQIISSIMIPFFGIPLWLSELVLKRFSDFNSLGQTQWFYMGEEIKLQYSNNFTLLNWVVPQVIVCWLTVLLFLRYKEYIEYYLFLMLPAMLFGTFSFLGLVPIAFAYALEWGFRNKELKAFLCKIFSVDNLTMLFTQGAVLLLYFCGNVLAEKPGSVGFHRIHYGPDTRILYIVFVAINVLIYAAVFWRDHKTDMIYYAAFLTLAALPAFSMGLYNDLMMRISIPALFLLMIYVIEFIGRYCAGGGEARETKALSRAATSVFEIIVIVFVLVGMYYSFYEISGRVIEEDYKTLGNKLHWDSMEVFANREIDTKDDVKYNYYTYDVDDNFFYKYIADRTKEESER